MAPRAGEEEEKYAAKESEGRCPLQNQTAMGPQGPPFHDTTCVPDRAPWTQPCPAVGSTVGQHQQVVTSGVSEAE